MKKLTKAKISYEPEADVLSWEISKKPIDDSKEIGNFIVHFSKENMPVLVEVLEARRFLREAERVFTEKSTAQKKIAAARG